MYHIWTVWINEGISQYYIVNRESSSVQSIWKNYSDAVFTCAKLNREAKRLEKISEGN